VIAGKYRRRPLVSLPGMDTRPTSDRLRETLFNVLCSANPAALEGSRWLDLYAGTGAVGIEALSRGATEVCFVEGSAKAAAVIAKNLRALAVPGGFQLIHGDVQRTLLRMAPSVSATDFVFMDPPYGKETEYARTLHTLSGSQLLGRGAVVIAEHWKKFDPGGEFGDLHRYRVLEQGDASLSFYRR